MNRLGIIILTMTLKILVLSIFLTIGLIACAVGRPISPDEAQASIRAAWQRDQHMLWEITWTAMPVGGPVVIETWRAGQRYRYEILEAPAPALVGEMLVFDGQQAWRYNRFQPMVVVTSTDEPWLAPISEVFKVIENLNNRLPQTATQSQTQLDQRSTQQIVLAFENQDYLAVWIDSRTGLPSRLRFSLNGITGRLEAREAEPLRDPAEALFKPID